MYIQGLYIYTHKEDIYIYRDYTGIIYGNGKHNGNSI